MKQRVILTWISPKLMWISPIMKGILFFCEQNNDNMYTAWHWFYLHTSACFLGIVHIWTSGLALFDQNSRV